MKICPAELFQAKGQIDGQTDMTKLIVAFCNFAHTSNNGFTQSQHIQYLHTGEDGLLE
jgi:hypothetical protein